MPPRGRRRRKRDALARLPDLDLSQTTWHELPHPRIVNAITFVARRGMHRYPIQRADELRDELAAYHGVPAERLILGNGAAELLERRDAGAYRARAAR